MHHGGPVMQEAALFQVLHDHGVGFLDELAIPGLVVGNHFAVQIDALHHRQSTGLAQVEVLFSEGRGNVHDAGAIGDGDEVSGDNSAVCRQFLTGGHKLGLWLIEAVVEEPVQVPAGELLQYLPTPGAQSRVKEGPGKDKPFCGSLLVSSLDQNIGLIRRCRQCHVACQCPGCGGPGQYAGCFPGPLAFL